MSFFCLPLYKEFQYDTVAESALSTVPDLLLLKDWHAELEEVGRVKVDSRYK